MALFTAEELEEIRRADKEISRQINEETWAYRTKKPRQRKPKTEEQIAAQRQKRLERQRLYKETHREQLRAYRARPEVKAREKEYHKAYYAKHREEIIEKSKAYNREHKKVKEKEQ